MIYAKNRFKILKKNLPLPTILMLTEKLVLALGNKWTYEWANKEGGFSSSDIYEVTGADNTLYFVSHYYYAIK